jgi:hypothetical protein
MTSQQTGYVPCKCLRLDLNELVRCAVQGVRCEGHAVVATLTRPLHRCHWELHKLRAASSSNAASPAPTLHYGTRQLPASCQSFVRGNLSPFLQWPLPVEAGLHAPPYDQSRIGKLYPSSVEALACRMGTGSANHRVDTDAQFRRSARDI